MEHLLTSFTTVAPLLLMMAVGLLLARTRLVPKDVFLIANRIVYYVGLPALIFRNLIRQDDASDADPAVILLVLGGILGMFVLSWLILPRIVKDPKRRGAITQAMLRSNDSIFTLTVAAAVLGEGNFGMTIFTAALSATLFNLLSILTLEINRGQKPRIGVFIKHVLLNPVILAVAFGHLFRWFGWTLPAVLQTPIDHFAAMVTPLGFLILGGILSWDSLRQNRKALLWIAVCKLLIVPLVMTGLALLLGFRNERLLTVLLIFAAPTAMASYPLAAVMESDAVLAGEAVALTTACSLPTVFLFLTIFGGLL